MPPTDLVPCFYTGQNRYVEPPVRLERRDRLHASKKIGSGRFVDNGKHFQFIRRIETAITYTGPPSAKNILAFLKTRTDGEKLHYEIPMAGDRSLFARHHRSLIQVSSRSKFSVQILPA